MENTVAIEEVLSFGALLVTACIVVAHILSADGRKRRTPPSEKGRKAG